MKNDFQILKLNFTRQDLFYEDEIISSTHLLHMPAHIYCRSGLYYDCILCSKKAIFMDNIYVSNCLSPLLPLHNQALLVVGAMALGNLGLALRYSHPTYDMQSMATVLISGLFPQPLVR